jgi:hypothetical protein
VAEQNYGYRGAEKSGDGSNPFNASQFQIDRTVAQIGVAVPVKVVRAPYDKNGNDITPGSAVPIGYLDVLPLVNQLDGYEQPVKHGTVYHVSYFRYQGGNGAFITDPVKGDIGKMILSDKDTSVVKATDGQANPGSGRRFSMADGTYFGCPQAGAPLQYFAWLTSGFKIIDKFGNSIQGTSTGVLINGFLIKLNGDAVTQHGTDVDTHVHTNGGGVGNSGPPP